MKTAIDFKNDGLGKTEQQWDFLAALVNGANAEKKGYQMCGFENLVNVVLIDYAKGNEIKFRLDETGTPVEVKVDYLIPDAQKVTPIYEIINTVAA